MKKQSKCMITTAIISVLLFSFFLLTTENISAQSDQNKHQTDGQFLMEAFKATQGDLMGTRMNFWGKIENKEYSQEEMKKLVTNLAAQLKTDEKFELQVVEKQDHHQVQWISLEEEQGAIITIESVKSPDNLIHTYLMVDLSLGKENQNLARFEKQVKNNFADLGFPCESTITLIGTFSEKMNTNKMRDTIGRSFTAVEAKVLEEMEETQYNPIVSLTGHSPKIKNSLQIGGQNININGAMRYNEKEGKTYFWLGTPLITTEY